ncbi:MAG: hypothetical protein Q4A75_05320 [Peptostreptococcaceae bacterium]|nr:hypothetical protein [Peptostreptococcaceae bacterium]
MFSEPSLIEGLGRLVDWGLSLNMYNDSGDAIEMDHRALRSDWIAVGDDIREAIKEYDGEEVE